MKKLTCGARMSVERGNKVGDAAWLRSSAVLGFGFVSGRPSKKGAVRLQEEEEQAGHSWAAG
jgi:hypothetical protein